MAYGTNSNGGYSGTIIASPIRPADPLQTIATVFSNEVKGSLHTYPNITERDALIEERRDWGMLCYVISTNKTYQLVYNFNSTNINDDSNWTEFAGSGGGGAIKIDATTINGYNYTASATNTLTAYSESDLYIVSFDTTNTGASVSLNIDSLGDMLVKKTDGQSLTDIITSELTTSYYYLVTYNGSFFELLYPTSSGGSGLSNKYYIDGAETVTVPPNTQYWIYGDLGLDGVLNNYGEVVVANGSLNIGTGTFNDYGTYSNIYFAEINGLGQTNYVPRWVNPYMLTASSSIYDDGSQVNITSYTFSVSSNFVLPTGATDGYILTSDASGNATWQEGVKKYSIMQTFVANATYSISHNLNSYAILFNFWNEDNGTSPIVNIYKTGLNTIDVMSTSTVTNGRVVIIS
jgi:hypothetical protein